jgi:hypothetical protein
MKKAPQTGISRNYKRAKWFGMIFFSIGCLLSVHSSVSLYQLYHAQNIMFVVEKGLSYEKGQMWVKLLTGSSVMLIGVALMLSAVKEKNKASHKSVSG